MTLKAFAVLHILVEKTGHLVTKDELMRKVWPDALVEDSNLAQAVSALRKVLGESHRDHQNHEYYRDCSAARLSLYRACQTAQ